jgi:hypothetical protein
MIIKQTTYIILAASALAGCSTLVRLTADLPLALSTIRSPITVKNFVWPENGPIAEADRGILNCAGQLLASDLSISRAVAWNEAHSNIFCKTSPFGHGSSLDTFDTFEDLCTPQTHVPYSDPLLFVAISGGGARATALASHALAILEQKYNAYHDAGLWWAIFPFIDRIAVFSTVSGGSLYGYQVAALKTLLDDAQATLERKKADGSYYSGPQF